MAIRNFNHLCPNIAETAFIDESALVIGDVEMGEYSSVWPMAVLRGDINKIRIGRYTNIQDGTIIHVNHASEFDPKGSTIVIGEEVTIGHRVVLHGCTIKEQCLIGIGTIIMDHVLVHPKTMIGANSLVPPGKELEGGYLWLGSPVKKVRPLTEQELSYFQYSAHHYARLAEQHRPIS